MRTVWSFGIPEGTQGKDTVASMGKLLSSPLKLNIQEGLLSISSAWEPVKGEVRRGLVKRAWWVMFSTGFRDRAGLTEAAWGGQRRRPSPALHQLTLQCSGSHWAKGRLSLAGVRGCTSPLQVPGQMEGRRNEGPWPLKRKTGKVELQEICTRQGMRASGQFSFPSKMEVEWT